MINTSEQIPLRVCYEDLNQALKSDPQYDEFMKIKNLHFANSEDLIHKTTDLLASVKQDYLPWEEKEFIILSSSSFVYLFQKFDAIYQQKYNEILNSNHSEEDASNKKLLAKLFQCEQTTHVFLPWDGEEVANDLVALLEVLYDDHENLDALLLLLNYKGSDSHFIAGPSNSRVLHFMAPFLKVLYGSEIHLLDCWKGIEKTRATLLKKGFEGIEVLLKNYSNFGDEEISTFCKEIQEVAGDLTTKRTKLGVISKQKDRFLQETKYYEALGALSLIYHLWCLDEQETKISMAFLRIGLVTFLYSLKEWDYKSTGHSDYRTQFSTALVNLNLRLQPELPSEVLVYLLNECKENIEKEEYLQMLELNACVLQYLFIYFERRGINVHFKPKVVQYIDSLLMKNINGNSLWSEFLKVIIENREKFSQVKSNYIATNCLQETLLYTWILFLQEIQSAGFVVVNAEGKSYIDTKYLTNIWKSLDQITQFMIKDPADFASLPVYLQSKIIVESSRYWRYENLIAKIDLFEIYHAAEEEMKPLWRNDSGNNLSIVSSHLFYALQKWSHIIAVDGQNVEKVVEFIKKIFAKSKLIEEMKSLYQEKRCIIFSRDIKDSKSAESFARFAIFILRNIKNVPSFLEESKNVEFTKYIIEDILSLQTEFLQKSTVDELSCALGNLYSETEILKKFDSYKPFFMFVRYYVNKPCLDEWEDEDLWEGIFRNLMSDEKNTERLVDLFEEFLALFEKKVRNLEFDLEKALKNFEVRIEKQEEKQDFKAISLQKNGKDIILDRHESLEKIFIAICRRFLPLLNNLTKSFEEEEEFEKYSSKLKGMVSKIVSLGFSPVCMFGTEVVFFRNIKSSGGYILDAHERYFGPFLEGILTGVVNLCEEFKLNEESTMKKINIQRICEMLLPTQPRKFVLRAENIPQDLLWEEAALISFIQAQYVWIDTLNNDYEPPFNLSPEMKDLLQKAIKLSMQISKNFYKRLAEYIAEESAEKEESGRLDILSKRLEDFVKKDFRLVKNWASILDLLNKENDYREEVKKLYGEILENIFMVEDMNERAQLVYNSFVIREIASFEEGSKFTKVFLLKEKNFERVLQMMIDLLSFYRRFGNSFDLKLYSERMTDLVEVIQVLDLEDDEEEEKESSQLSVMILEKIVKFVEKFNSLKLSGKLSERLDMKMSAIFICFQDIYEFYLQSKTEEVNTTVENKVEKQRKNNEEEEKANNNNEDVEDEEDEDNSMTSNSDSDSDSKKELTEQDKQEIIKFAKALGASEFLKCDHIEWFLDTEKEMKEFWLTEYLRIYKNNIKIILEILTASEIQSVITDDLREEIKEINTIEDEMIPLSGEVISNRSLRQLIQLNWIFKRQRLFFTEKLADELKLSQNFVEGMVWAVETALKELQDNLQSETRDPNFPEILNELVTNTGSLAIDYIVASVSENQGEDLRRLMFKMFDLVDRYFEVHQYFMEILKWDILSGECFEILMNCLTAVLKSNKDLRVDFLNRESLYKLLTIKKGDKLSEEQLHSLSFLTSVLLEESLVLESNMELVFKEIALKEEQVSLEKLLSLENFAPFKCYKRTLEFLKPLIVGNFIELKKLKTKTTLKDHQHNEEIPIISYLQKTISPVAKKTLQAIFIALIENYGFEEHSKDSRIKYYQRKEQQQKEKDDRELEKREPLDLYFDPEEKDKPVLKEDTYYAADLKTEKLLVKDTSALIVLLSGVMQNTPYLIPYMIFQKADMDEILQIFKNDEKMSEILNNKRKNWSMLDVLLRLAFYRDGESVLHILGGLINAEFLMNTTVSGERLGDLVITKIYRVFQEILARENSEGEAYKTLESVQMRKSMTICLLYLSEKLKNLPYLSERKQEIMQLNLSSMSGFLENYSLLAELTENTDLNNWIIPDIANLIKSNIQEESEIAENNYSNLTEAIEASLAKETKEFPSSLSGLFEQHIFNLEKEKEVNREEQKLYEIWDEKEQWGKEDAKSILSYASVLKSSSSRTDIIDLPIKLHEDVLAEEVTLDDAFYGLSDRIYSLVYLYKVSQFDGSEKSKLKNLELDYRQDRCRENCEFLQTLTNEENSKSFKMKENEYENLPKILRPNSEKAKDLEKQKNIFDDYLANVGKEQKEVKTVDEVDGADSEKEDEEESESKSKSNSEVGQDEEEEEKLDKHKEKPTENSVEKPEINYRFFLDKSVRSKGNFKFKINQALKKSRRVKEIICIEMKFGELLNVLRNAVYFEEIICKFVQNLSEFEKNVVYAGLGSRIASLLSLEIQENIKKIQDELESIKKDYHSYAEKLKEIQEKDPEKPEEKVVENKKQDEKEIKNDGSEDSWETDEDDEEGEEDEDEEKEKEEQSECDSKYDELDYDFEFLGAKNKEERENSSSENSSEEEEEDDESVPSLMNENLKGDFKAVGLFRADDRLILEASKLFFSHFVIRKDGISAMLQLFGEALSLNPVNEIKIFDTLLFVLYSPECLEEDFNLEDGKVDFPPRNPIPRNSEYNSVQVYEATAQNIIAWLCAYLKYNKRSSIFFMPKENFDKFGNQLLKNLKEKTGFMKKVSGCHTVLDMTVSLLEIRLISRNREWIDDILTKVNSLMQKGGEKALSKRAVVSLLELAKDPADTPTNRSILGHIRDIFSTFQNNPSFARSFQASIKEYWSLCLAHLNDNLASHLKLMKEGGLEDWLLLNDPTVKGDLQVIEIIFSFLCNAFSSPTLVEDMNDLLFNNEEAKTFILDIYELLEWKHKQNSENIEENSFVLIILYHFSIVLMMEKYEKSIQKSDQNDTQNTEENLLPSLARLVSSEDAAELSQGSLQWSFSSLRKELNVDFRALFKNFAWKYSSVISKLNNSSAKNSNSSLSHAMTIILPQILWIIDFDTKVTMLENQIHKRMKEAGTHMNYRRDIKVDRNAIVHSAMQNFKECSQRAILQNLELRFKNEDGVDGGGLRREFFALLAKDLFDPRNGLFRVSDNHRTIQPNPFSEIIPNDLKYLEFAGIVLAKAICDKIALDLSLTKPFLKHILGKEISIRDLEDIDADLLKNLEWTLRNPVDELELTFTHEMEFLGQRLHFDLKESGSEIKVNEENKREYVKKICEFRMTKQIKRQIQAFLKGFYLIIPKNLMSHLTVAELEIVISGAPKIDLQEMKKYATYRIYNENFSVIRWFWEILQEFDQEKLATFYYYLSGSVKVPIGGFKQHPIRIRREGDKGDLPVAHTCSYELDLPEYEDKEKLREKLLQAIFDGADGFYVT